MHGTWQYCVRGCLRLCCWRPEVRGDVRHGKLLACYRTVSSSETGVAVELSGCRIVSVTVLQRCYDGVPHSCLWGLSSFDPVCSGSALVLHWSCTGHANLLREVISSTGLLAYLAPCYHVIYQLIRAYKAVELWGNHC